jgi:DNA-directed RNA polymerase subunit RPC12/RpoP
MTEELVAQIDVDKRTTRGRACPRCGGKIIPSNRAVYEASNPEDSFPVWQCERCGYEEMSASKKAPAKKAAAPAPAAAATGTSQGQLTPARPAPKPAMLDSKGRAHPPDVIALLQRMAQPKDI